MLDKVLEQDDFYVICPDNETTTVSVCGVAGTLELVLTMRSKLTRPASSGLWGT